MKQRGPFGGTVNLGAEIVEVQGLLDVVVGAGTEGLAAGGDVGMGRHQDDRRRGRLLLGEGQDFQAVAPAFHDQVGDDDVVALFLHAGAGFGEAVRDVAAEADALEGFAHDLGVLPVVIDDQQMQLFRVKFGHRSHEKIRPSG